MFRQHFWSGKGGVWLVKLKPWKHQLVSQKLLWDVADLSEFFCASILCLKNALRLIADLSYILVLSFMSLPDTHCLSVGTLGQYVPTFGNKHTLEQNNN